MIIDFDSKNNGGGGKEPVVESLSVTENGIYNAPSGVDGYNPVEVNVPQSGGTGFDFKQLNGASFLTYGATLDLTGLDTSTFTRMYSMFSDCYNLTSLDISHFDTSNVTIMNKMFNNCSKITSLDLSSFNTSKVENMGYMFYGCSKITSFDLSHFNTANVTNMGGMFYSCDELTSLNISNWDARNVTSIYWMFENCYSLETIVCDGLKLPDIDLSSIGLNNSSNLTVESLVGLLNALPQSTNGYSFQIGQTNINKLSDDQKAIATNKGWTLK